MFQSFKLFFFPVFLSLMLSACGSGGGGGGGGGGSAGGDGSLSVSPGSVDFYMEVGGSAPSGQNIIYSYSNSTYSVYSVAAGYPPDISSPGWLSMTESTSTNSAFRLMILSSAGSLGLGQYSTTVRVATYRITGDVIDYEDVPVTLHIVSPGSIETTETTVTINATEGIASDTQAVSLSTTNLSSLPELSITTDYTDGSDWLNVTFNASDNTLNFSANALANGTYNATTNIQYLANGIPKSINIPVVYEVAPVFTVPDTLDINSVAGVAPASQDLNISYSGSAISAWNTSINYQSGENDWLTVLPGSGSTLPAALSFSAIAMAAGSNVAELTINYTIGTSEFSQVITITNNVADAWSVPGELTFNVNSGASAADLTQDVAIGDVYTTADNINWTATVDVGWITLSPLSGDSDANNTLTVTVTEAELVNLEAANLATITLVPTNPLVAEQQIPVSLNINVPIVKTISPNFTYTGEQKEHIIRGFSLSSVNANDIEIGGQPVESLTIISDTEVHVHPAASVVASAAKINVDTNPVTQFELIGAELNVIDKPSFPQATIPLTESPITVLFDPVRNAIFYTAVESIHKLQYSSGSGWAELSTSLFRAKGLTLMPDGQELLVASAVFSLVSSDTVNHVNPDTLTITNTVLFDDTYEENAFITSLNNEVVLVVDTYQWSTMRRYPSGSYVAATNFLLGAQGVTSVDKDRALFGQQTESSAKVYLYDASDDELVEILPGKPLVSRTTDMSHRNERTVIGLDVYDAGYNLLGSLDTATAPQALAVSPDGSKVYVVNANEVATYDISGATGPFPQTGSSTTFSADAQFAAKGMLITQDGSTLMIYNDSSLTVYPLP